MKLLSVNVGLPSEVASDRGPGTRPAGGEPCALRIRREAPAVDDVDGVGGERGGIEVGLRRSVGLARGCRAAVDLRTVGADGARVLGG